MSDLSSLSGEELKSNFGPSGPLMTPNRKSPAVASGRAVVPPIYILRREGWSILSLGSASGHIDVLHAQQSDQTIIVRFRGSDHE